MTRANELLIYRKLSEEKILSDMTWLMDHYDNEYYNDEDKKALLYDCMSGMLELASRYGLEGNLWHTYLTYLLVNDENPYSTASEIRGNVEGTLHDLAYHDFEIIQSLFHVDFSKIEEALCSHCFSFIENFQAQETSNVLFNKRVKNRICKLAISLKEAKNAIEFQQDIVSFYQEFGVGKLGLHKAFRVENRDGAVKIVPIRNIPHVHLDDLVGYEIPKKKLIDNTKAFVEGKPANNCLLFGDAGTGKSSSVKGILNEYYDQGLRIIEVYKHQFQDLNSVIAQIKNRNYKFIIYMDDLSFEEFEIEYKYLKAVIEGGLEKKPDNVLIYATSNRRHLIKENFSDKEGKRDELHASDTVQEKLSLVARFGVSIFFIAPDKKEFQEIVRILAKRHGVKMEEERLFEEANKWELYHGGRSGRTAQQFIDYLLGLDER
ncbi:MAG TPA: ATP-binding protein [Candidatus Merdenecus merdavium]|nr:ATP-binding protein [Candidatus Merdenecus merdavium]